MARLHIDDRYGPDGQIGMTLAVDDGPMLIPGPTFTGAGRLADGRPFAYSATAPDRRGVFDTPECDGWTVELESADHVSGTARYIAKPQGVNE